MNTNQLLNWLKNNLIGKDITKMSPEQAKMKLVAIQTLLEVTLQEHREEENIKEERPISPPPIPLKGVGAPIKVRDDIKEGWRQLEEEMKKRRIKNPPYTLLSSIPLDMQFMESE